MESESPKIKWKIVVLTAFVTGLATLAAGVGVSYVTDYLRSQQTQLVYSVDSAVPFETPSTTIVIYRISIRNSGSSVIEDVTCQMDLAPARINQTKVTLDPSLSYDDYGEGSKYKIHFASMNPNDNVTVSVLAWSSDGFPSNPTVSLRGRGVTGLLQRQTMIQQISSDTLPLLLATSFAAAITATLGLSKYRAVTSSQKDMSRHSDDQRQILAYLCDIRGLEKDSEQYRRMPSRISYWSEADRFASLAIKKPRSDEAVKRRKVLEDLLAYAEIESTSEAIVHYDIARIANAQGVPREAREHLAQAQKLAPKLVKTRTELQPSAVPDNQ